MLTHEPSDAVFTATRALPPQTGLKARTVIDAATGLENRFDLLGQLPVLLDPLALRLMLVRVISAGTDFQCLSQFLDLIIRF